MLDLLTDSLPVWDILERLSSSLNAAYSFNCLPNGGCLKRSESRTEKLKRCVWGASACKVLQTHLSKKKRKREEYSRSVRTTAVISVWCYHFTFCSSDGLLAASCKSLGFFSSRVPCCTPCFQNPFKLFCFFLVAISFPCALLLCSFIDLNYFIHPWGGEKAASLEWQINCIFCSCW